MTTTKHLAKPYISNPFKSSFEGLTNLFNLSQLPALVILAVSFVGGFLNLLTSFPSSPSTSTTTTTSASNDAIAPAVIAIITVAILIGIAISIFVGVVYTGIVNYVTWKTSRGESTTLNEAFNQTMRRFWRILLIQIIVGIKVFFGTLALIVPGIRAALRYQMVFVAMFDEDLKAGESINRIKQLTRKHLMEVFGIMTVAQLLFPVAILLQMGGESILYPQLKHIKDNNLPKPPTHWLNYIGFAVFALLFFVILSFAILAVVVMSNLDV